MSVKGPSRVVGTEMFNEKSRQHKSLSPVFDADRKKLVPKNSPGPISALTRKISGARGPTINPGLRADLSTAIPTWPSNGRPNLTNNGNRPIAVSRPENSCPPENRLLLVRDAKAAGRQKSKWAIRGNQRKSHLAQLDQQTQNSQQSAWQE